MLVYDFISLKGGQGATVTAAAFASALADHGVRTLFTDADASAVCAVPSCESEAVEVKTNLWCATSVLEVEAVADRFDAVVVGDASWSQSPSTKFVVTRACYLALVPLSRLDLAGATVILVEEPDRAIKQGDVVCIAKCDVVAVSFHPTVSRAVDAGLLVGRVPKLLSPIRELAARAAVEVRMAHI